MGRRDFLAMVTASAMHSRAAGVQQGAIPVGGSTVATGDAMVFAAGVMDWGELSENGYRNSRWLALG